MTYTLDNQIATLTAVNSTTGDQTTTYTYGSNASSSSVGSSNLLASVTYPDSVSGSDVVSYSYNRLGEQRTREPERTFAYLLGQFETGFRESIFALSHVHQRKTVERIREFGVLHAAIRFANIGATP